MFINNPPRKNICHITKTIFSHLIIVVLLIIIHQLKLSSCESQKSSIRTEFTYILDEGYPIGNKIFGNIAGVDVDENNNVILFHRGSHVWSDTSFDNNDIYQDSRKTPIQEETVVTIDPKDKKIIRSWGRNTFFLPHGLSLDLESKNLWLTDVALHQVYKYSIDGSKQLMVLGTPFEPGNDENHFCKPTSVADTGEFIFVADGYCNSRIVMFSNEGKYLGEFGQSADAAYLSNQYSSQPTFKIPHKITYAKEANMLCVADRENGRIQCFSFEPKRRNRDNASLSSSGSGLDSDSGLILSGAIKQKFTIADPQFNGRLFSIDYCPIGGGVLVAVSGKSLYSSNSPALGFVYNVTTGQLISRFSPPKGKTFGMAHDLAVTNDGAKSLYVVDITPVNLWRFSRPAGKRGLDNFKAAQLTRMAGDGLTKAVSLIREQEGEHGFFRYLIMISALGLIVFIITKTRRLISRGGAGLNHHSSNLFPSLYSNNYSTSINSLFGNSNGNRGGFTSRTGRGFSNNVGSNFTTMFSRGAFHNIFNRNSQQQNDFSRIPMEDDDNSDDDKSDSDVEEFNINQAAADIKINV